MCICFLGHLPVCCSDCYAAQLISPQTLIFLDKADLAPEIETLKTTSEKTSEAEEPFSFSLHIYHHTQINGTRDFSLWTCFLKSYKPCKGLLKQKKKGRDWAKDIFTSQRGKVSALGQVCSRCWDTYSRQGAQSWGACVPMTHRIHFVVLVIDVCIF